MNTTRKRGKTLDRTFFGEQIALLQMAETDELIEKHFHKDAILISTTNIVWGCEDLKLHSDLTSPCSPNSTCSHWTPLLNCVSILQ